MSTLENGEDEVNVSFSWLFQTSFLWTRQDKLGAKRLIPQVTYIRYFVKPLFDRTVDTSVGEESKTLNRGERSVGEENTTLTYGDQEGHV